MGACGGDSDGNGGATAVPIDDVPALYADALCSAFESCFGVAFEILLPGEDCLANTKARIEDDFASLKEAIADGRAKYDGTKIKACADAIKAQGCDFGNPTPAVCTEAFDGTIAEGGACTRSSECQGADSYCKVDAACPGACAKRLPAGSDCADDSECAQGLNCSGTTNKCVKLAQLGQACGGPAEGCGTGLLCLGEDEDAGTSGTCTAASDAFSLDEGEACFFDGKPFCKPELRCTLEFDVATTSLTAACAQPASAGAACTAAVPDPCPVQEYCLRGSPTSLDGTCTVKPSAGQPCAADIGDSAVICAPGLRCDGGTCRPLQSLGASCVADAVCYSENCQGGTCSPENGCDP